MKSKMMVCLDCGEDALPSFEGLCTACRIKELVRRCIMDRAGRKRVKRHVLSALYREARKIKNPGGDRVAYEVSMFITSGRPVRQREVDALVDRLTKAKKR
jgi:hypothetical protein